MAEIMNESRYTDADLDSMSPEERIKKAKEFGATLGLSNVHGDVDGGWRTSDSSAASNMRPVLSEDDEMFLQRATSDLEPPSQPLHRTIINDNGEETDIADPASPHTEKPPNSTLGQDRSGKPTDVKRKWHHWAFVPDMPSKSAMLSTTLSTTENMFNRIPSFSKRKEKPAQPLESEAKAKHSADSQVSEEEEASKERRDLSAILSKLHLSAVNNRVFSLSKDSEKLFDEFKLVLKDIVNGVPTAYDDLEKLLTRRSGQLDKIYNSMPPFLQTLVKSLPTKMFSAMGPEVAAAAAATAATFGASSGGPTAPSGSTSKAKKKRNYIPSLRSLVSEKGAVIAMLRSILSFLTLRFPAIIGGTTMFMSLSVFLLLFVFWYLHKRGKATRLGREQGDAEESVEEMDTQPTLQGSNMSGAADWQTPADVPLPKFIEDASYDGTRSELLK